MSRNNSREGETTGFRHGNLRFKLRPVTGINFDSGNPDNAEGIVSLKWWLRGLSSLLNVFITGAIAPAEGTIRPNYPALPGVMQVTPYSKTAGGTVLFGKPLGLVPQSIPHTFVLGAGFRQGGAGTVPVGGDYGASLGDGALIEVFLTPTEYEAVDLAGNFVLDVTADYNGAWWDVDAIQKLFGELTIDSTNILKVQTAGS